MKRNKRSSTRGKRRISTKVKQDRSRCRGRKFVHQEEKKPDNFIWLMKYKYRQVKNRQKERNITGRLPSNPELDHCFIILLLYFSNSNWKTDKNKSLSDLSICLKVAHGLRMARAQHVVKCALQQTEQAVSKCLRNSLGRIMLLELACNLWRTIFWRTDIGVRFFTCYFSIVIFELDFFTYYFQCAYLGLQYLCKFGVKYFGMRILEKIKTE